MQILPGALANSLAELKLGLYKIYPLARLASTGAACCAATSKTGPVKPSGTQRACLTAGDAMNRALQAAKPAPQRPPNLRDYKWPVLKVSGVRSVREFERGLQMVSIDCENGEYAAQRYRPDVVNGRGFDPDEILFRIGEDCGLPAVAERLAQAFDGPDWPTR